MGTVGSGRSITSGAYAYMLQRTHDQRLMQACRRKHRGINAHGNGIAIGSCSDPLFSRDISTAVILVVRLVSHGKDDIPRQFNVIRFILRGEEKTPGDQRHIQSRCLSNAA
jgi:hypothetical protein